MKQNTLPGHSRLKGRKVTEALWAGGQSAGKGLLRARYRWQAGRAAGSPAVLIGFSAPKKWFRKAVQRNYCKRLLRECWRHRRAGIEAALDQQCPGHQLHLFWVVSQPGLPSAAALAEAMDASLPLIFKHLPHDPETPVGAAPAGLD